MASHDQNLIGAVFPGRTSAAAAAVTLRRRGIAGDHVVTAVSHRGRHVVDSQAQRRMVGGLLSGAVLGAALLSALAGIVGAILADRNTVWLAAAVSGFVVGAVLGAYVGLSRERPPLWEERDWLHIELDDDEVLLVAPVGDGEVRALLEGHGGRCVEPESAAA